MIVLFFVDILENLTGDFLILTTVTHHAGTDRKP